MVRLIASAHHAKTVTLLPAIGDGEGREGGRTVSHQVKVGNLIVNWARRHTTEPKNVVICFLLT